MRVLVVEDSTPVRNALVQGLREAGYAVDEAADGEAGLWHANSHEHDVVVLDLMLPKLDGIAALKSLHDKGCPARILVLTAKDTLEDKVRGLEMGADDYLVKPFHFAELLARVKALVRRKYGVNGAMLTIADLEVDLNGRIVRRGDEAIDLSGREYSLIEYLALNAEKIVSRTDIWHHVYDFNAAPESNVVDVYVARLRAKIERPGKPRLIHTKRGQGYFFGPMANQEDDE